MEFDEYLAGLGEPALAALLRARPDVLVEPVPRGFAQLAQRLSSASSLVAVLQTLNRDQLVAGEAITAGRQHELDRGLFRTVLPQLKALGLVWGTDLRLPPLLAHHWSQDQGHGIELTGPPALPLTSADADTLGRAAQAAAAAVLDGVTSLLDKATSRPITALQKGGIGSRELSRLARELAAEPGSVALWLDVAGASGLLGTVDEGFAPTTDYPRWRESGRPGGGRSSPWRGIRGPRAARCGTPCDGGGRRRVGQGRRRADRLVLPEPGRPGRRRGTAGGGAAGRGGRRHPHRAGRIPHRPSR